MSKKRVYEIAKEEGLPSATLLQRLIRVGAPAVKTASSTVDQAWALHAVYPNRYPKPELTDEERKAAEAPAPTPEPEPEPEPEPVAEEAEEARAKPRRPRPRTARGRAREQARATEEARRVAAERGDAPSAAEHAGAPERVAEAALPAPEPVAEAAPPAPEPVAEAPVAAAEPTPPPVPEPVAEATPPPAPVEAKKRAPVEEPTPAPGPAEAQTPAPEPVAAVPTPEPVAEAAPEPRADATPPEAARTASTPETTEPAEPPAPTTAHESAPAETPATRREASMDDQPGAAAPTAEPTPVPASEPAPAARPDAGAGRGRGGRGKRRRVVIDASAGRPGRGGPAQGGRDRRGGRPGGRPDDRADGAPAEQAPEAPVEVPSGATVKDLAEAIELLADELKRPVVIVRAEEEADREGEVVDAPEDLVARAPVVTIMGHVDHGKTSLLDAVRSTEVAAGEAGGITQHIGAYQVHHGDRELTFLDTPGHEAFTAMRARGAKITDVAVIVVAADDGVMPQTIEAIDHARAAEVPFLVAVNKIDKPDANPDRVKQELSQRDVIPAEWGGTHEFVDVSALEGTGLESLLETVLLVADADAEPKANPTPEASGTVIESRLDPGRGPVTSLLVQRGTLRIGDVIVAGEHHGRVRAMSDHTGAPMTSAGPSVPVEMLGMAGVTDAGERFRVAPSERVARQLAGERGQRLRAEELANRNPVSLDDVFARIKEGGLKELNLIIKGDVQGSVGALVDALGKIEQDEVRLRVIHTGVGAINESDVMLATASQAIIIGFSVRPRPEARLLAEREGVDVRTYRVIYRAIEDVRDALLGMLEPEIVEEVIGSLEVRATFRSSRLGTIAGCYVTDGVVRRSANVRLVREGTVVYEGTIASLRRVDEDAREVSQGFECGILLTDYNDVKEGDVIEAYELREVARAERPASEPVGVE